MLKFALPFSILLLSGSPAIAQGFDFTPPINGLDVYFSNQNYNDAIDRAVDNAGEDDSSNITPNMPSVSTERLSFSRSKARTESNIKKYIERSRASDPAGAEKMERQLLSSDIIGQIDQAMRPMGLRADNVADAYTVWWVAAWEAVNKRDAGSSSGMYGAVKQQASNALLSTPAFSTISDPQKQQMAEALLIQAALIDGHIAAAAGNAGQQAQLAQAVNQGAKKMGLDLTKMDLTENGFVPRSGGRSDASDAVEGADPAAAPTEMAANDDAGASTGESDTGKLALYGVGGVALLAGMFALGKSFGGKG